MTRTLLWFRRDLRLGDNAALQTAMQDSAQLLPVYVHAPDEETPWQPGAASKWWLHHSLTALQKELRRRGSDLLVVKSADSAKELLKLCRTYNCRRVVWARLYEPAINQRDQRLARMLNEAGIDTLNCPGNLLREPDSMHNRKGQPYRVFTPFWKTLMPDLGHTGIPTAAPLRLPALPSGLPNSDVARLELLPHIRWDSGLQDTWHAGEGGAHRALDQFTDRLRSYPDDRDRPDRAGTSRLSPHLHFGELSVRQIVHACHHSGSGPDTGLPFLRELGWREFAHHLLHHFPDTAELPLDPRFRKFPWRRSKKDLRDWQRGETGIPTIDAGMRQLWSTGWMHNRVRMLVASFLTKHLRLPWQWGAAWFWDTLVDADLANNTLGWQWTAGCGADAAPYFRVFNPVLQGSKFDPMGSYVRHWLPELNRLPAKAVHAPWQHPAELDSAGIRLGRDYPQPMVDLAEGRNSALAAFKKMKSG